MIKSELLIHSNISIVENNAFLILSQLFLFLVSYVNAQSKQTTNFVVEQILKTEMIE